MADFLVGQRLIGLLSLRKIINRPPLLERSVDGADDGSRIHMNLHSLAPDGTVTSVIRFCPGVRIFKENLDNTVILR